MSYHHHNRNNRSSSSSSSSSSNGRGKHKKRHHHGQQYPNPYGNQPQYGYGNQPQYGYQPQYGNQGQFINPGQYGNQGQFGNQYGGQGQFNQMPNRDEQIRVKIDHIYSKYDRDGTGQLDERQFQAAIGQLCQMLNKPPPQDYTQFIQIAKSVDTNYDGRISKQQLFLVFKRLGY